MQKLKNWPNYFKFDIIKSTLPIEIPKSDFLKEDSIPMWLPNDDYVLLSVSLFPSLITINSLNYLNL